MKLAIVLRGGIHISHICSKLFWELEKWTFQGPQPETQIKINQAISLSTHTHQQDKRERYHPTDRGGYYRKTQRPLYLNPPSEAGKDPKRPELPPGEAFGLAVLCWHPTRARTECSH